MRYIKEYNTYTSPGEERINDILDRGIDIATQDELDILRNQGEVSRKKKFFDDKFQFELEKTDDFGDEVKVTGTLTYHNDQYYGWFILPKDEEQRGKNTWDFFQGSMAFDPNPDDLYDLDSMIQEIEFEYLDK